MGRKIGNVCVFARAHAGGAHGLQRNARHAGNSDSGSSMPMGEGTEGSFSWWLGSGGSGRGHTAGRGSQTPSHLSPPAGRKPPQHPQSPNLSPLSPPAATPRAGAQQSPESITFRGESTKSGKAGMLPSAGAGHGEGGGGTLPGRARAAMKPGQGQRL